MIQGHGFGPMRHCALRVARRCLCKRLLGLLVLERVQERDAFLNCGLHVGGSTRREIHFAKLIGRERPGGLIRPDPRRIKEKKKQQESDERDQGSLVAQVASPPAGCDSTSGLCLLAEIKLLTRGHCGSWTRFG